MEPEAPLPPKNEDMFFVVCRLWKGGELGNDDRLFKVATELWVWPRWYLGGSIFSRSGGSLILTTVFLRISTHSMVKKSVFRGPDAQHFQLVHRSQRDPLINDPEAAQRVLKPVGRSNDRDKKVCASVLGIC